MFEIVLRFFTNLHIIQTSTKYFYILSFQNITYFVHVKYLPITETTVSHPQNNAKTNENLKSNPLCSSSFWTGCQGGGRDGNVLIDSWYILITASRVKAVGPNLRLWPLCPSYNVELSERSCSSSQRKVSCCHRLIQASSSIPPWWDASAYYIVKARVLWFDRQNKCWF